MNSMFLAEYVYKVKRWYHWFKTGLLKGLPAQIRFGFPQRHLKIIMITGTDGKTTSSSLLYHIFQTAGHKVALISTVAAFIGQDQIDTGFHVTNPDPASLYKFLRRLVTEKYEYLILETTSHGIYQHRNWGIRPLFAGVTNITHEHLDYHLTYQNYLEAKAMMLNQAKIAVLNADDQSFSKLKKVVTKPEIVTYAAADRLPTVVATAMRDRFAQQPHNQMNTKLCYHLAGAAGIAPTEIAKGIKTFPGIPGRMQWVPTTKPFRVVVDFAHTPNGLEKALTSVRQELKQQTKPGRLIAVYGAAGLRDWRKRPMMGAIGAELADLVVLTAEDPRTENVWSIIRQMKEQLTENHQKVISIADRGEAITFALTKLARAGDIVGIFGKGHEQSMCYGTVEYPWSDVTAVTTALTATKGKTTT